MDTPGQAYRDAIILASLMILALPQNAQAGGGTGAVPIPATELTQMLNNFELLHQSFQQAEALLRQARQIELQVQQLKSIAVFDQGTWTQAMGVFAQLDQIVRRGQAMAYSVSHLDAAFERTFPGYRAPEDFRKEYQVWTATTLDSIRNSLLAANFQANEFASESSTLVSLQGLSDSAVGQTQAIQAGNMMASEMVIQLQKLRQLISSQMQAQNAFMANQVNQEAVAQKQLDDFINVIPEQIRTNNLLSQ